MVGDAAKSTNPRAFSDATERVPYGKGANPADVPYPARSLR